MQLRHSTAALFIGLGLAAASLQAQGAPSAPATDYRSDTIQEIELQAAKYIALAEAIPAEMYTWRPAEGVRSVSEVLMHVAGANYYLPARLGTAPPPGVDQSFERSTTDKAEVIRHLRSSFEHQRRAFENAPQNAEGTHQWFGGRTITNRGIGIAITGHLGEHLGQLIAYARVNGLRPPWAGEG